MKLETIDPSDRYAEFHFSGALSYASVLASFREVLQQCTVRGLDAAIVDLSATAGTLDALSRIQIARTLSGEWTRGLALAVVVNEIQHMPERPAQLAAQNRGMRAREFTDLESARAWIRSTLP